jgi:hypothetical protein
VTYLRRRGGWDRRGVQVPRSSTAC